MLAPFENATEYRDDALPIVEVSGGVSGSDGRGIGHLVDARTIRGWLNDYLGDRLDATGIEPATLVAAFQFGVRSEGQYAGKSFVEAEPDVRSEWSSQAGQLPWESVRDVVWAGFDRARNKML